MLISLRRRFLVLALPVAVALSACGGVTPPTSPAGGDGIAPRLLAKAQGTKLPSQLLFIPNGTGSVYVYPLKNPNQSGPVGLISGLLGLQMQSVVDAKGNFYIAAQGSGFFDPKQFYVAKFAPPYTGSPTLMSTTWHGQVFAAVGLTVDAKGNVYVSACGDYCGGIDPSLRGVLVYPPGATSPQKLIAAPAKFDTMGALTLDTQGDVYGMTWNKQTASAEVFEIVAGTASMKRLWLHGFYATGDTAGGIAFDTKGDFWVTSPTPASSYVLEYKPGQREPFRQVDPGNWLRMAGYAMFLSLGADGNLYVPLGCGAGYPTSGECPQVYAFGARGGRPLETIGSQNAGSVTASVATFPNPMLQGSHP